MENFLFSNAKRLRPIFIFTFSKILNIENKLTQDIALITEIIHNASLIHDDIIDEEKTRRNQSTLNSKYGVKLAVLEGDLLLSIALELISNTTLEISKIFSKKIKETINGEINQNKNTNQITDVETYYKKTIAKTGNLFFAGLKSLFTLKEIDTKTKEDLENFLKNYALAFQIKNDIDNFKTDSTDFKNGNYTLTVIYFFMKNNTADFNQKSEEFKCFLNKAKQEVERLKILAIDSLKNIENSKYKTLLIEITNYTLRS